MARPEKHVFVCVQQRPSGHPKGSCAEKDCTAVVQKFQDQFEQQGYWGRFGLTTSGCLGTCEVGPSVLVYPEGIMYGKVTAEDVVEIIEQHLVGGTPVERLKVSDEIW